MALAEKKTKTHPWEWLLAAIIALGQLEHIFEPLEGGLDFSWKFAVNLANELSLSWGADFFFTYGPLGFVNYLLPIGPLRVLATGVLLKILIPLATFLYLFHFLKKCIINRFHLWIVFLFVGGFFLLPEDTDIFLFLLVILICGHLLGPAASTGNNRLFHALALGFSMAVLGLLKLGSFLLGALSGFLLIAVLLARRDYQVLGWGAASFLTIFFILWNIFSGPTSSLWRYLQGSLEISRHFSTEMSMDRYPILGAFLYLLFFVIFPWVALGYISLKRRWTPLLEFLFLLLPFIFYVWKISVVRSDHMLKFLFLGSVPALMLAALERQRDASASKNGKDAPGRSIGYVGAWATALGAAYLSLYFSFISFPLSQGFPPFQMVRNLVSFPSHISQSIHLPSTRQRALEDFHKTASQIPKEMQSLIGAQAKPASVDIFPWEISELALARLTWKPRPVIQSYSAYSPWLDGKNARHLRENGPDFILFSARSIDGRYQPSDEPLTLDEIRASYQPVSLVEKFLLLERSPRRTTTVIPLSQHSQPQGKWMDVPDEEDLYVRVHAPKNFLGTLGTFFFRDMGWTMEFKLSSGETLSRRVVTANLESGIYVSRFLKDIPEFAVFFQEGGEVSRLPKIEQFRLTPVYSNYYHEKHELFFERRAVFINNVSS